MTILFACFLALLAAGLLGIPKRWSVPKGDFMSRDMTSCINGFFIALVFLAHLRNYIPKEAYGQADAWFLWLISKLGQLIVTTFLFYSGYGIMESIKRKEGYIRQFPSRRILTFLLDVWLAVAVYLVLTLLRGEVPPLDRVLLSMVGWLNLGNSNWYIFAILWMYVVTYGAFRLAKGNRALGLVLTTLGAFAYILLMKHEGVGAWYYSTILCYPAGMLFSLHVDTVRKVLMRPRTGLLVWAAALAVLIPAFLLLHGIRFRRIMFFEALSVVFVLIIVLVCVRVPCVSRPFAWVGKNLFCFYIYQRVPMIVLTPLLAYGTLCYEVACLVAGFALCAAMTVVHRRYKALLLNA